MAHLRSIEEIPNPFKQIFEVYPSFNPIQSAVLDDILYKASSVVITAPTGSGKTVIFELAIVNLLMGTSNYKSFKAVYIAPVKALCNERYVDWSARFCPLGISCIEVTGDNLDDPSLEDFQIIMTTPEKWDSFTRKWRDKMALFLTIRLILIDEVHLIRDEKRGPILESIVCRMKTMMRVLKKEGFIRFIAVSATIFNIEDLASWLGSRDEPAVYHRFGNESRPVALQRIVKGYHQAKGQSEFLYDIQLSYKLKSILVEYADGKPALIFCSTRRGVLQTAKTLAEQLSFRFTLEDRTILLQAISQIVDSKLRDSVLAGIAYHHAGMISGDRNIVQNLFMQGALPVLVATTTLAMGVNLPAHLVIVKSTHQYIAGRVEEYPDSTVLQMIGRAGRPQFDTSATAVILTRPANVRHYENLLDCKEILESSLHLHLAEHLNSEIVLLTITDLSVAMEWLRCTFLYQRALKSPQFYGLGSVDGNLPRIEKALETLILREINALKRDGLVHVNDNGMDISPTANGRLMSHYYINFLTFKLFTNVKSTTTINDLLLLLSDSNELSEVQLRVSERRILNELNISKQKENIRFPMKGKINSRSMKINCLVQACLGCLAISDPSLHQEALRVVNLLERVVKCLVDYLQRKQWYIALVSAVVLAKCLHARLWENSVFVARQLERIGPTLSAALVEYGKINFESLEASHPQELERIANRSAPMGSVIIDQVRHLPRYLIHTEVLDFKDRSCKILKVSVSIANRLLLLRNSTAGPFHRVTIIIGDTDNRLLHSRQVPDSTLLKEPLSVSVTLRAPMPQKVYIKAISNQWVGIDVSHSEIINPFVGCVIDENCYIFQRPGSSEKKAISGNRKNVALDTFPTSEPLDLNDLTHKDLTVMEPKTTRVIIQSKQTTESGSNPYQLSPASCKRTVQEHRTVCFDVEPSFLSSQSCSDDGTITDVINLLPCENPASNELKNQISLDKKSDIVSPQPRDIIQEQHKISFDVEPFFYGSHGCLGYDSIADSVNPSARENSSRNEEDNLIGPLKKSTIIPPQSRQNLSSWDYQSKSISRSHPAAVDNFNVDMKPDRRQQNTLVGNKYSLNEDLKIIGESTSALSLSHYLLDNSSTIGIDYKGPIVTSPVCSQERIDKVSNPDGPEVIKPVLDAESVPDNNLDGCWNNLSTNYPGAVSIPCNNNERLQLSSGDQFNVDLKLDHRLQKALEDNNYTLKEDLRIIVESSSALPRSRNHLDNNSNGEIDYKEPAVHTLERSLLCSQDQMYKALNPDGPEVIKPVLDAESVPDNNLDGCWNNLSTNYPGAVSIPCNNNERLQLSSGDQFNVDLKLDHRLQKALEGNNYTLKEDMQIIGESSFALPRSRHLLDSSSNGEIDYKKPAVHTLERSLLCSQDQMYKALNPDGPEVLDVESVPDNNPDACRNNLSINYSKTVPFSCNNNKSPQFSSGDQFNVDLKLDHRLQNALEGNNYTLKENMPIIEESSSALPCSSNLLDGSPGGLHYKEPIVHSQEQVDYVSNSHSPEVVEVAELVPDNLLTQNSDTVPFPLNNSDRLQFSSDQFNVALRFDQGLQNAVTTNDYTFNNVQNIEKFSSAVNRTHTLLNGFTGRIDNTETVERTCERSFLCSQGETGKVFNAEGPEVIKPVLDVEEPVSDVDVDAFLNNISTQCSETGPVPWYSGERIGLHNVWETASNDLYNSRNLPFCGATRVPFTVKSPTKDLNVMKSGSNNPVQNTFLLKELNANKRDGESCISRTYLSSIGLDIPGDSYSHNRTSDPDDMVLVSEEPSCNIFDWEAAPSGEFNLPINCGNEPNSDALRSNSAAVFNKPETCLAPTKNNLERYTVSAEKIGTVRYQYNEPECLHITDETINPLVTHTQHGRFPANVKRSSDYNSYRDSKMPRKALAAIDRNIVDKEIVYNVPERQYSLQRTASISRFDANNAYPSISESFLEPVVCIYEETLSPASLVDAIMPDSPPLEFDPTCGNSSSLYFEESLSPGHRSINQLDLHGSKIFDSTIILDKVENNPPIRRMKDILIAARAAKLRATKKLD